MGLLRPADGPMGFGGGREGYRRMPLAAAFRLVCGHSVGAVGRLDEQRTYWLPPRPGAHVALIVRDPRPMEINSAHSRQLEAEPLGPFKDAVERSRPGSLRWHRYRAGLRLLELVESLRQQGFEITGHRLELVGHFRKGPE